MELLGRRRTALVTTPPKRTPYPGGIKMFETIKRYDRRLAFFATRHPLFLGVLLPRKSAASLTVRPIGGQAIRTATTR